MRLKGKLKSVAVTLITIMPKFYAVRKGRSVGIYFSWDECKKQVDKFPGARYKSFQSCAEAEQFIKGQDEPSYSGSSNPLSNFTHPHSRSTTARRHVHSTATYRHSYTQSYPRSCTTTSSYPRSYSTSRTNNYNHSTLPIPPRPVVYSDGCCYRNGQSGASAGVGVYWGENNKHNVSAKLHGPQTNQRAELTAAYMALEGAIAQGFSSVEIKTDSSYTIKALTEWVHKWERNGWKTSTGDDVKNRGDMERLLCACKKIDVKWTHVAGHQGITGNEMADQLAKLGSQK